MKDKIVFVLLLVFVLSQFPVLLARAGDQKIGIVRLQDALNQVEEGKKAKAKIEAELNAKKQQLDTMKEELKKMRDELEKQKLVLSKEALEQKAGEMQAKFVELQKQAMTFEQELKQKELESVSKILASLKTVVIEVAKAQEFDLVYENSADTLIYSKSAVDLTAEVIKAYNRVK